MLDYSIFYQQVLSPEDIHCRLIGYDIFISAYNESDRVRQVFEGLSADRKIWIIHPEYCFEDCELPSEGELVRPDSLDEVDQIEALLETLNIADSPSICVDLTGFMRHVISFMIPKFGQLGIQNVTFLYSEPVHYKKSENTLFSTQTTGIVRPVRGMGASNFNTDSEYLIVGVGYDHAVINQVVSHKDSAELHPIFAFPSLSADMYQQSAVRAARSGLGSLSEEWLSNKKFAPANNPFATAQVLQEIESRIKKESEVANIYLAPLATKVQVLGFALYWWLEGRLQDGVSVILPECSMYSRETSVGLGRVWKYEVELALVE